MAISISPAPFTGGTVTELVISSTATIGTANITTALLGAATINTATVTGGSVTTATLGAVTVNTGTVTGLSVTTATLGAVTVDTATITAGTVTTATLGDATITTVSATTATAANMTISSTATIATCTATTFTASTAIVDTATFTGANVTTATLGAATVNTATVTAGSVTTATLDSATVNTIDGTDARISSTLRVTLTTVTPTNGVLGAGGFEMASDGNPLDPGDQVQVGDLVYTVVSLATAANGTIAYGTYSPVAGNTINIPTGHTSWGGASRTYEFVTEATTSGHVLIDTENTDNCWSNLASCINTNNTNQDLPNWYGYGETHVLVTAVASADDNTVTFQVKRAGPTGNVVFAHNMGTNITVTSPEGGIAASTEGEMTATTQTVEALHRVQYCIEGEMAQKWLTEGVLARFYPYDNTTNATFAAAWDPDNDQIDLETRVATTATFTVTYTLQTSTAIVSATDIAAGSFASTGTIGDIKVMANGLYVLSTNITETDKGGTGWVSVTLA